MKWQDLLAGLRQFTTEATDATDATETPLLCGVRGFCGLRGSSLAFATMLHSDLTEPVIGAFYEVYHALGYGFLESVYERALLIAISKRGLSVERHLAVKVHYDGQCVGRFFADLIVERRVVLELKACRALDDSHEGQLLNYLRATNLEVGLLLLFARKPVVRRVILTNDRKPA